MKRALCYCAVTLWIVTFSLPIIFWINIMIGGTL